MRRAVIAFAVLCWAGAALAAPEASALWLDVPFVKQPQEGCGAASIAMVMQFWLHQQGRALSDSAEVEQIQRSLYSRQARGIYASDAQRYFQQHGFRTFAFRGEWPDLEQHLAKGRPLIVALKPGGATALHYVVVAGLDNGEKIVLLNDPAQRKLLKQDQSSFEQEWSAAGRWTLLALPQPDAH